MSEDFDDEACLGFFGEELHHLLQGSPPESASQRLKYGQGNIHTNNYSRKDDNDNFSSTSIYYKPIAAEDNPIVNILDEKHASNKDNSNKRSGKLEYDMRKHYSYTKKYCYEKNESHNLKPSFRETDLTNNCSSSPNNDTATSGSPSSVDEDRDSDPRPKKTMWKVGSPFGYDLLTKAFSRAADSCDNEETQDFCTPLLGDPGARQTPSHSPSPNSKPSSSHHTDHSYGFLSYLGLTSRKRHDTEDVKHEEEAEEEYQFKRHELETVYEKVYEKVSYSDKVNGPS